MKFAYQIKHKAAYTMVEALVAIVILSGFVLTMMFLYRRSTETFKITVWKQERTAQAEIFWSFMRKHIEEATNFLDLTSEVGKENPVIPFVPRPFKFHPTPGSAADGNILAWNVSNTKFDFSSTHAHSSQHTNFFLVKRKKRIELVSSASTKPLAALDDVEDIAFTVSSIVKDANKEEIITPGADPNAVGTMFEISLTLKPPQSYMASDIKIPHNHKFRVNVPPHSDSAPSY
ncbi:MAG TPA: hypothetical protein PKN29_02175 [Candidatus Ozemobacteraceae bacterium]|nr:hypothetical protein [Candidatus Ozemobacteraceae bacterium]